MSRIINATAINHTIRLVGESNPHLWYEKDGKKYYHTSHVVDFLRQKGVHDFTSQHQHVIEMECRLLNFDISRTD